MGVSPFFKAQNGPAMEFSGNFIVSVGEEVKELAALSRSTKRLDHLPKKPGGVFVPRPAHHSFLEFSPKSCASGSICAWLRLRPAQVQAGPQSVHHLGRD